VNPELAAPTARSTQARPSAVVAAPKVPMIQFVNSYRLGQLLSVAARLGVADALASGPRPIAELAEATGAVASSLYRVLRALAALGVFEEVEPRVFGLTPLAATLRSDAPVSLRGAAAMLGEDWHWRTWSELGHSVRTGAPAFDAIFGLEFNRAYEQDPAIQGSFDQASEDLEKLAAASIRAAYSFDGVRLLVNVEAAGGFGGLLAGILNEYPETRGVFVDRDFVVGRAEQRMRGSALAQRIRFVAWDSPQPLPEGGDVYLLRNVLRDQDDAGARDVLTACRAALGPGGRLLVVEMVIAPGNELSMGKIIDIDALLFTALGRERSVAEYRALLSASGFDVTRVIPTPGPLVLIEATASETKNGALK